MLAANHGSVGAVTRAVANSCPRIMLFASLPGAVLVRRESRNAEDVVRQIAGRLAIALSEADAAEIVAELAGLGLGCAPSSPDEWEARIPDGGHKTVDGALGGYAAHFG